MAQKTIIKKLQNFKKEININTPVMKMYLFGSRAWGKPQKYSDVDIMIVSKKFQKTKSFKRGVNLYTHWNLDYPVDFLCYTPKEFNKLKKQTSIVSEAIKKGIEI